MDHRLVVHGFLGRVENTGTFGERNPFFPSPSVLNGDWYVGGRSGWSHRKEPFNVQECRGTSMRVQLCFRFSALTLLLLVCRVNAQQELKVTDFGAHPTHTGVQNSAAVTAAIQHARDNPGAGPYVLRFPHESSPDFDPLVIPPPPAPVGPPAFDTVYHLSKKIEIFPSDNIVGIQGDLFGDLPVDNDPTSLGRHADWPIPKVKLSNDNRVSRWLLYVSMCNGVTIKDLILDGDVSQRMQDQIPMNGIVLAGCRSCMVQNIRMLDFGTRPERKNPGGSQILMVSAEPGLGIIDVQPGQASRSSAMNVIKQCIFHDVLNAPQSSFAVRLATDWTIDVPFGFKEAYAIRFIPSGSDSLVDKIKTVIQAAPSADFEDGFTFRVERNTVRHNDFRNGFYWNAIEIAGPATRENTVRNNFCLRTYQSPLDADKGASLNLFENNLIVDVRPNDSLPGYADNRANTFALRDQGTPPTFDKETGDFLSRGYFNIHNRFVNNVVRLVDVSDKAAEAHRSAGMMLRLTQFSEVSTNLFENFVENGQQSVFLFRSGVITPTFDGNLYSSASGTSFEGREPLSNLLWLRYWGDRYDAAGKNQTSLESVPEP